jgi:hypothetical protein
MGKNIYIHEQKGKGEEKIAMSEWYIIEKQTKKEKAKAQ